MKILFLSRHFFIFFLFLLLIFPSFIYATSLSSIPISDLLEEPSPPLARALDSPRAAPALSQPFRNSQPDTDFVPTISQAPTPSLLDSVFSIINAVVRFPFSLITDFYATIHDLVVAPLIPALRGQSANIFSTTFQRVQDFLTSASTPIAGETPAVETAQPVKITDVRVPQVLVPPSFGGNNNIPSATVIAPPSSNTTTIVE